MESPLLLLPNCPNEMSHGASGEAQANVEEKDCLGYAICCRGAPGGFPGQCFWVGLAGEA